MSRRFGASSSRDPRTPFRSASDSSSSSDGSWDTSSKRPRVSSPVPTSFGLKEIPFDIFASSDPVTVAHKLARLSQMVSPYVQFMHFLSKIYNLYTNVQASDQIFNYQEQVDKDLQESQNQVEMLLNEKENSLGILRTELLLEKERNKVLLSEMDKIRKEHESDLDKALAQAKLHSSKVVLEAKLKMVKDIEEGTQTEWEIDHWREVLKSLEDQIGSSSK